MSLDHDVLTRGRNRRRIQIVGAIILSALFIVLVFANIQGRRDTEAARTLAAQEVNAANTAKAQLATAEHNANVARTAEAGEQTQIAIGLAAQETSEHNADLAETQVATVQTQAAVAQETAAYYEDIAQYIALAADAQLDLEGIFPERAVLLALEALENYPYTWQAERALGAAVQQSQMRLDLRGHTGPVRSAAFSPDGARIVTASGDDTAKVWDSQTGAELLTLQGHTDWVNSAAFSPDGTRIVTVSNDDTARVWDSQTGAELITLRDHTSTVYGAAFSPDGARIVTASRDGTAKVWRIWQTTEDLIDYAQQCCTARELTNGEREMFGLPTYEGSPPPTRTPRSTRTPIPTLDIWPTLPSPTPTPTRTPPPTSPPITPQYWLTATATL